MKNKLIGLAAALVAALSLAPISSSQAEATFVMNFGTAAPAGTPWSTQLASIKKRIETESAQRVKIKLFLGSSLGSEIEMAQDTARGERLQGGGFSTGAMGTALKLPLLELPELPYLFKNTAQADAVLDDVLYEPVSKALATKNIKLYAWAENGWRNFATKTGPIRSPADLSKLKMRAQESATHMDMYSALGVKAVSKPISEVLPSLNTGIVDGFDNTPLFSMAAGWMEPVKFYTLSRHIYQPAAVVYTKSYVDKMPPDLQAILLKDAKAESVRGRAGVRKLEGELLETMKSQGKQVVELTEEERKLFRQACKQSTLTKFLGSHPELQPVYGQVKAKLDAMK
jgi:TRAP-type C4-dicarboxylate transport system substrate-binding protein